jgi:2-dehydropantoate 2-reductase
VKHAVLGVGGVGGLVAGALGRAGQPVELLLSDRSLAAYPGTLRVRSALLGDFEVPVPGFPRLAGPVDVLWVTVKATQLEAALPLAPAAVAGDALVVPLLNGVDHVAVLRERYADRVLPASIAVEAEKVGPGLIVAPGPFVTIMLAPGPRSEALAEELRRAGLGAAVGESEAAVLWTKLAVLAPLALGTSSAQRPLGEVRADPELWELVRACIAEVCAAAATEGVSLDPERFEQMLAAVPAEMRSSMQKDLAAGRPLELDAIAGPVLRRGAACGLPTPATEELRRRVAAGGAAVA